MLDWHVPAHGSRQVLATGLPRLQSLFLLGAQRWPQQTNQVKLLHEVKQL